MTERWLLFLFGFLSLTFAFYAGLRVRPESRRGVITVISICLVPVVVRTILILFPTLEYRFLDHDAYALLRTWWSVPFSIALFVSAAPHMSSRRAHAGLIGFSLILWACGTDRLLATAVVDSDMMEGVVERDEVCRQTTNFTCGAAAATLLYQFEIDATEAEMAELCWTNAVTGTDEMCIARGLRRKIAGRNLVPHVRSASWEDLLAYPGSAAVTVRYKTLIEHWVVVFEASETRVIVGDPMGGRRVYSAEAFQKVWCGLMVTIEEDRPGAPKAD